MLSQEKYAKLSKMNLSSRQMQQVIDAAGGLESKKSVGGFAGNVMKSGGKYLVDVTMGLANIFNPNMEKNTLANLVDLIVDTGAFAGTAVVDMPVRAFARSKGITDEQYDAVVADIRKNNPISTLLKKNKSNALQDVGGYYADRYRPENLGETLYTDPVGVLGDVSGVAQMGGGLISKAGQLSNLPKVAGAGQKIAAVGRTIEPINLASTGIAAATSKLRQNLGKNLIEKSESLATKGLGNPAKQADFKKKFGMSPGEMIKKYDLWSRDPDLAAQIQAQTGEKYTSLVRNSKKTFSVNDIISSIDDRIKEIQSKPVLTYQAEELMALKEQRNNLINQYNIGSTDLPKRNKVRLYRGLTKEFDKNFDLSKTDAPTGYSTWTDNPELAKQYAGKNGFVYEIDLPKSQLGEDLFDIDGERVLFLDNNKKAGLNNVSGKEYLIYNDHELYNPNLIKNYKKTFSIKASDLLDYRQSLDKNIAANTFDPAKSASAKQAALKTTRDILKSNLDTSSPQVAALGKTYGGLKQMSDLFKKSQARASNRQSLNFTKLGSAGVGGVMAGAPGAIAGFAAEQFINSPTGTKTLSNLASSVGSSLTNQSSRLGKLPQVVSKVAPYSKIITQINEKSKKKNNYNAFTPSISSKQKINVPRY